MNQAKAPHEMSLEEQRDALLMRIHASREEYRQQMHAVDVGKPAPTMEAMMHDPQKHPFPRSQTMRWLMAHPGLVAGTLAVVVLVGPRRVINGLARTGPLISSAAAGLTMVLQDPAKMRMAGRGMAMMREIMRQRASGQ
jgi:hypothetical protein